MPPRTAARASPTGWPNTAWWGIQGIDTRAITRRLRDGGAVRAAVANADRDPAEVLALIQASPEMAGQALAGSVSAARGGAARGHGARARPRRRARLRGQVIDREPAARRRSAGDGAPVGRHQRASARPQRRRRPARQRPRRPGGAEWMRLGGARADRRGTGVRHLPGPPAAGPGPGPGDLQASLRPPRRQPPGARAHRPERCL